eukprot:PhF_6_TR34407/c0_g1_i2/m.50278
MSDFIDVYDALRDATKELDTIMSPSESWVKNKTDPQTMEAEYIAIETRLTEWEAHVLSSLDDRLAKYLVRRKSVFDRPTMDAVNRVCTESDRLVRRKLNIPPSGSAKIES